MGMDLVPVGRSDDDTSGDGCLHFNWGGWWYLQNLLADAGVDLSTFANVNDGEVIPADVCRVVADTIESKLGQMSERDRMWLGPHIAVWRRSPGFEQW
jgi:hypothetical protein